MRRTILLLALLTLVLFSCAPATKENVPADPSTSSVPASEVPEPDTPPSPGTTPDLRGITWPEGQVLPTFASARHLQVVDVRGVPGREQMLFTTLQGLLNRQRPRIYLIQTPPEDERGRIWLRHLDVPSSALESPWQLLERYAHEVRGTIVYDPAVPDTVNVATTLAGLESAVVASPEDAERLNRRYGLPVIDDLRGRFADAMDAYTWQYEELWPRATHRMLVALPARHGRFFGALRDYAVANRAMVYWLDPTDPVERGLYERILSDVQPGAAFVGWFPCCGPEEWSGVELLSEHGVITFAADRFQNMTVFSAPCCHELPDPEVMPAPPLEDKIYVTFTFSDGDNLAYDQNSMRGLWDNPDRGRVPMNWTISPALWDAAPSILRYYRETATANDLLVAGVSGVGYVYPTPWPDETFHLFTELTARYVSQAGMDIVWVFNIVGGQPVEMSQTETQAYIGDVDPRGMMLISGPPGVGIEAGTTPLSSVLGAVSVADARERIAEASGDWDGYSPLFLSVHLYAWEISPSDVVEIASSLGSDYVVVRADQYFELIGEATSTWPDLALGKPTTASDSVAENPPSMAVDRVPGTYWNSGDYAPQWVEIDLGSPQAIGSISLLTAQLPDGDTVHRVLGKASAGDPYRLLHTFAGFTADGQWLRRSPVRPWEDIRFLRVQTTASPSWVAWKEIHLYPPA